MLVELRKMRDGAANESDPKTQARAVLALLKPEQSSELCARFDAPGAGGGCGGGCGGHTGEATSEGSDCGSGTATPAPVALATPAVVVDVAAEDTLAEDGTPKLQQVVISSEDEAVETLIQLLEKQADDETSQT